MTRTSHYLSGIFYGYINQFLVLCAGLILTPFYLFHLGEEKFGLWVLAQQLLLYLDVFVLGLSRLLPREIALRVSQGQSPAKLLRTAINLTSLLMIPGVVAVATIPLWFPDAWAPLQGPILWIASLGMLLLPLRLCLGSLEGFQDLGFLSRLHLAAWALGVMTSVAAVLWHPALISVLIGWFATQSVLALGSGVRLFTRWVRLREILSVSPKRPEHVILLKRSLWIYLNGLGNLLHTAADLTLLSRFLGPVQIVPYELTSKLKNVLTHTPQLLVDRALPGLSDLRGRNEKESIQRTATALTLILLFCSGALATGILVINGTFVSWWVGPSYFVGIGLTMVILLDMICRHWLATSHLIAFCFGNEKALGITSAVQGATVVVATILLIPHMGIFAPPTSSIIGMAAIGLPVTLGLSGRGLSEPGDFFKSIALMLVSVVGYLLVIYFLLTRYPPQGLSGFVAALAMCLSGYLIFTYPALRRTPAAGYLREVSRRIRLRTP